AFDMTAGLPSGHHVESQIRPLGYPKKFTQVEFRSKEVKKAGGNLRLLGWEHASSLPGHFEGWEPILGEQTAKAAIRIVERFHEEWSAIDIAVRAILAANQWAVGLIMPDGSISTVAAPAWGAMRFQWDGEAEFTACFPRATVLMPDEETENPLSRFRIRRSNLIENEKNLLNSPAKRGRPKSQTRLRAEEIALTWLRDEGEDLRAEDSKQADCERHVANKLSEDGLDLAISTIREAVTTAAGRIAAEKKTGKAGNS
ncbi:hypothetical protein, partial [Gluconacetobacter tumulicola]